MLLLLVGGLQLAILIKGGEEVISETFFRHALGGTPPIRVSLTSPYTDSRKDEVLGKRKKKLTATCLHDQASVYYYL